MTSSPLFINVAESMVILGPIDHVGWRNASSGVTAPRSAAGRSRNGPPDAVSMYRRTSRPVRDHRRTGESRCARCRQGESPRRGAAPPATIRRPAITSTSLLASATVFPASMAASVAPSAAVPADAHSTRSTRGSVATATRASSPHPDTVAPVSAPDARRRPSASSSASATTAGRTRAICSAKRSTLRPAARPTTSRRSGCAVTTERALRPIEPVEPRMAIRFTAIALSRGSPRRSTRAPQTRAHRFGPARRRGRE